MGQSKERRLQAGGRHVPALGAKNLDPKSVENKSRYHLGPDRMAPPTKKRHVAIPQEINWTEEDEFDVEYIVAAELWRQDEHSRPEWAYLTKWVGFDSDQNTWEPKDSFSDCPDVVVNFWAGTSRKTEPTVEGFGVGHQISSNKKYQIKQIAAVKKYEYIEAQDGSDREEPLFLSSHSDEEIQDPPLTETSDNDTVDPEQLDPSSPRILTAAIIQDIMSMSPHKSIHSQDGTVDPREIYQERLDNSMGKPAAYTNISEFLPDHSPRKSQSPLKASRKRQSSVAEGMPKQTAIRYRKYDSNRKKDSTVPKNHPNFFSGSTATKNRRSKSRIANEPTGFDSRIGGTNLISLMGQGQRTTTISLEDSTAPRLFTMSTGTSKGAKPRRMQHLQIDYGPKTGQTKDRYRSNLELPLSGIKSVRFGDLPADAPAESVTHVSATDGEPEPYPSMSTQALSSQEWGSKWQTWGILAENMNEGDLHGGGRFDDNNDDDEMMSYVDVPDN